MAAPQPPPPPRGLSLYENLHDPNDPAPASATISSAPVLYGHDGSTATTGASSTAAPKKPMDPSLLRFQPTRRPQPAASKQSRPKATFPKAIPKTAIAANSANSGTAQPDPATTTPSTAAVAAPESAAPAKSTLAHWAATEDDEWLYGASEKRQRGGRKAKKKRLQQQQQQMETDWDDIYDPSRPTNVDEYLRSDEKVDEVREWKALLYRHRKSNKPALDSDLSSDEEDARHTVRPSNQFAPPPAYAAVPPPPPEHSPPPKSTPPPSMTGDDAYARRLALSQQQPPPPAEPESQSQSPSQFHSQSSTTISAAPILYNTQPPPPPSPPSISSPSNNDNDNLPQERNTTRPGQAGFAHRLMSKYGWTKGSGLGADESGILNPLRVQVEKRKKKSDAEGGGWAEPANKGRIIGGRRHDSGSSNNNNNASSQVTLATTSASDLQGTEGLSDVIVLLNMLENMPDLAAEVEDGLGQEIGEECGEKYGRVERVYIDVATQRVFIKFTDQVSALRAVSELQGRVFNGNTITPMFYNSEAFEQGVYTKL